MAGITQNGNDGSQSKPAATGPSQCSSRRRDEDAAEAVRDMAAMMRHFDPNVVKRLVVARDAATNIDKAFPTGDRRFEESDDDSEAGDGEESNVDTQYAEETEDVFADRCQGLLDGIMDESPLKCLTRAKEDYGFDLVAEMDGADLDFFERIRVANYIRRLVQDGHHAEEVIKQVQALLTEKQETILKNNSWLEPVIPEDVLLTVLENDDPTEDDDGCGNEELRDAVERSLRKENVLP